MIVSSPDAPSSGGQDPFDTGAGIPQADTDLLDGLFAAEPAYADEGAAALQVLQECMDCVVVVDRSLTILSASENMRAFLGRKRGELLGRSFGDAFPYARNGLEDRINLALESGLDVEFRWNYPLCGTPLHVNIFPSAMGALAFFRRESPVSERGSLGEKALAIVEASPDIVSMVDHEFRLVFHNRAGRSLQGIRAAPEMPPDPELEFLRRSHPEWAYRVIRFVGIPHAIRWGVWQGETALLLDGEAGEREMPCYQTILSHRDGDGVLTHVSTIIRDVSQQREATRALDEERLRTVATARMAALGEMAGNIAHEINNPLAVIRGRASQLNDHIRNGRFEQQRALELLSKIESMVDRVGRIIQSMRTLSRGHDPSPVESVSLTALVEGTVELCRARFHSAGVSLETSIPEQPSWVCCRLVDTSQVLLNLLNNAFDAAIDGEPPRWVKLDIERSADVLTFRVSDGGPGVALGVEPRIFDPFFSTKPIGKGTGLGLSISRSLIVAQGGTLWLEHQVMPTVFAFSLPAGKMES